MYLIYIEYYQKNSHDEKLINSLEFEFKQLFNSHIESTIYKNEPGLLDIRYVQHGCFFVMADIDYANKTYNKLVTTDKNISYLKSKYQNFDIIVSQPRSYF